MVFRIRHATRFDYEAPAYESHNEIRLRPCDDSGQRVLAFDLQVTPRASVFEFRDYFGNRAHSISIYPPHDSLAIVPWMRRHVAPGAGSLLDVGAGAGFPGVPAAIACPGWGAFCCCGAYCCGWPYCGWLYC